MSPYNISVVEPEEEYHFLPSSTNTLGLDLESDSITGFSNQSSFPNYHSTHTQLPAGSSIQHITTYGSTAGPENPSRPTLSHLNTTLGHPQTRSPINGGLHSFSNSNSPSPFLRDIDNMRPTYATPQRWPMGTTLSSPAMATFGSPESNWDLLSSPFPRQSPSTLNLSPLSTSSYLAVEHSPPSSISSGSHGSPVGASAGHYPTPSPRQEPPPLTPQSAPASQGGVYIESSPTHYSPYLPPGQAGMNAMDIQMGFSNGLSPAFPAQNQLFNGHMQAYGRPTIEHANTSPASFPSGLVGGQSYPYSLTCQPDAILGQNPALDLSGESLMVPQSRYRPHTTSDQRRYVDEVVLQDPIHFYVSSPDGRKLGIPLRDAITSKFVKLLDRDVPLFQGCGPSISVRLSWKGYQPWSRQIPTRDFRSPPGPITKAKLSKNVAKSIQRFIDEHKDREMEPNSDLRWAVGPGKIDVDDLLLVSMVHVSMGSWQAELQLNRPLRPLQVRATI